MDESEKRRHQWVLRLNDAQNQLVADRLDLEGCESRSWFVHACIAIAMTTVPPGRLTDTIEQIRAELQGRTPLP